MKKRDADRARAKDLFEKMSRKEKCVHVFRYYWMHMAAAAAALAIAVSIGTSVRESIAREDLLYIALQEGYYEDLQPAVDALAAQAQWPEDINYVSFPSVEDQEASGSYQLVLYLTADQLDLIVCDDVTAKTLESDETLDLTVHPLTQTKLGELAAFRKELYLITVNETGRADKVQQFTPVLAGTQE